MGHRAVGRLEMRKKMWAPIQIDRGAQASLVADRKLPCLVREARPVVDPKSSSGAQLGVGAESMRAEALALVLGGKRLLTIEPEPSDLAQLRRIMAPAGWVVTPAPNLRIARKFVEQNPPPVIFVPVDRFDEVSAFLPENAALSKVVATVRFSQYWQAVELLTGRAYDVLPQPLAGHEVLQVANFAWAALMTEADPTGWR